MTVGFVYIFILFIFSWICLYNSGLENVGFDTLFVVQTIFTLCLAFTIWNDPTRGQKTLTLHVAPPSSFKSYFGEIPTHYNIPLWWIIIPVSVINFVSSLLMFITSRYVWKKRGNFNISRDMNQQLNLYKGFYIACTVLVFVLLFSYIINYTGADSRFYSLVLYACIIGSLGMSIHDLRVANSISRLLGTITDG
jgi:hypothetical protein